MNPASIATSVNVSNPISGNPAVQFASPAPLIYTASKPAHSACRAIDALGTPGIATQSFAINWRNLFALVISINRRRPERSRGMTVFVHRIFSDFIR
jgi:hypothetical protein